MQRSQQERQQQQLWPIQRSQRDCLGCGLVPNLSGWTENWFTGNDAPGGEDCRSENTNNSNCGRYNGASESNNGSNWGQYNGASENANSSNWGQYNGASESANGSNWGKYNGASETAWTVAQYRISLDEQKSRLPATTPPEAKTVAMRTPTAAIVADTTEPARATTAATVANTAEPARLPGLWLSTESLWMNRKLVYRRQCPRRRRP